MEVKLTELFCVSFLLCPRYMLVDTFGGVYADMDMEPIQRMDDLLQTLG